MKKIILIFILILIMVKISSAYRASKPAKITAFDEANLALLNENLENLWDISNGRYSLNIKTSVPTSAPNEGAMIAYSSGGVYRIYIYLNGGWRSFTSD